MRIQLTQSEIEVALREYVSNQGFNLSNKQITITFTNTRNPSSTLADIDIEEAGPGVPAPRVNSILHAAEVETVEPTTLNELNAMQATEDEVLTAEEEPTEKKSLFG